MSDRHHCQKIAFAISSRNGHHYQHQIVHDSLEGNCSSLFHYMTIWCIVFLALVSWPLQSPTAWRFLVWDHCMVFVNIRRDSLMMSYLDHGHPPVCTFWRDVRVLILSRNWAHWQNQDFFCDGSIVPEPVRQGPAVARGAVSIGGKAFGTLRGSLHVDVWDVWERGIQAWDVLGGKGDYLP